jgi:hypothetical protein
MPDESTTPDLVEVTRAWIEANSYDEWAACAERFLAPNCTWHGLLGTFNNRAEILAFVKEYWAMWQDHHHLVEEIMDLGHGVMFWIILEHGRMKGSDTHVENRNAWVTVVGLDGRFVRSTISKDIDETRATAERLAEERG